MEITPSLESLPLFPPSSFPLHLSSYVLNIHIITFLLLFLRLSLVSISNITLSSTYLHLYVL